MNSDGGNAGAILLAGGKGSRAGFSANKAYVPIGGRPMISYSLRTLDRSPRVTLLVLVIRPEDRQAAERVVERVGITTPWLMVAGGETRHASEHQGLEALSDEIAGGQIDLVAIHDGARPFVSPSLLSQLFHDAGRHGGAVPIMPVDAPTHRLTGQGEIALLDQEKLHKAQTPQVFSAPELLAAYRRAQEAGFEGVDTAETVERFSDLRIRATSGDPNNLKLTFPEDFALAETIR
ncbi:MAG: IspD/TarI family cytidylyltransferase [bacterium]|nr:IspD/TarI family cytidylyltransferase [bacterium]MDE0602109.1 IspD/TarI family cytidylyltransferase [bacterium]